MGTALVTLPDGRKAKVTFDSQDQLNAAVSNFTKNPQPTPDSAGRSFGLGVRNVAQGLSTIPGLAYDVAAIPFNLAGANIPGARSQVQRGLTAAGLPEARTDDERLIGAGIEGAAAIPLLGLGSLAGATGGMTSEFARQRGSGPLGQTAAGLAAGLAVTNPRQAVTAIPRAARLVYEEGKAFVEPMHAAGKEAIKSRGYAKALDNDPAKIQQAIDLLRQGKTAEQVAVEINSPGLAAFLTTAAESNVGTAAARLSKANATRAAQANKLAGVQENVNMLSDAQQAQLQLNTQSITDLEAALQTSLASRQVAQQTSLAGRKNALDTSIVERQNALDASIAEREAALKASVPRTMQMEVGSTVTAERAKLYEAAKKATTGDYDKAFALHGEGTFTLAGLTAKAKELASSAAAALDPAKAPLTARILERFGETTPEASGLLSASGKPIGGVPKPVPAQVVFKDADEAMKAINADLSSLHGVLDSSANGARRSLMELKNALRRDMKEGVSPEAYEAYLRAQMKFLNTVDRPFRRGFVANLERQGATGEQLLTPSNVTREILKNEENAVRFVSSLGDSKNAVAAVERGVIDAYRKSVVKGGKVDLAAHDRFMDKYFDQINVLDDGGMTLRNTFDSYASRGTALKAEAKAGAESTESALRTSKETTQSMLEAGEEVTKSAQKAATTSAKSALKPVAETGKAEAAVIKDLEIRIAQAQGRVDAPANAMASSQRINTLAKDIPGLRAEIDSVIAELDSGKAFEALVATGKGAGVSATKLATESVGPTPTFLNYFATVANSVFKRFKGKVDAELAAKIAAELMDSPSAVKAMEKAKLAIREPRVTTPTPANVLAARRKAAVAGAASQNAMAPDGQKDVRVVFPDAQ